MGIPNKGFGLECALIIGQGDMEQQKIALVGNKSRAPAHIIIAAPGRLFDHLKNTKGFDLKSLKFLVLDEADKILDSDFKDAVDEILSVTPTKRQALLFSATMTKNVMTLQRTSLKDSVKIEVSTKYHTVDKLKQSYI